MIRTVVVACALLPVVAAAGFSGSPRPPASGQTPAPSAEQQAAAYKHLLSDWAGLTRYGSEDSELPPPAPGEQRVVFLGDQITELWGKGGARFFPGKPYLNRGVAGQTTAQMLVRFRQDVIDLHPKVVVILAGTNDIAGNTGPMRLEDIEDDYASLADLTRANGIKLIYSSVLPIHNYTDRSKDFFAQRSPEKILALNAWLKNYCAEAAHACTYLDYFSAVVDDKGLLKKELADDGLHPNAAGYKIMVPLAEAAIAKALK